MASHDGFLTQCGQNHDALLTAVVVGITAVLKRITMYFSNPWKTVARADDSRFLFQPVLAWRLTAASCCG
jgi:hypothetical protein